MAKSLIIVESPAKTKTLKNFLGSDFTIEASMGHVRDLPKSKLGVEVENNFEPQYVSIPERRDVIKKLKEAAAKAEVVYLASDPDREGEAIAWHLREVLKLNNARRIQFNEITQTAVLEGLTTLTTSTWTSSTPSRPAECSTDWWATSSARCCGERSSATSARAGCSRSP